MTDRSPIINALADDYTTADVLGRMKQPSLAETVRNFFAAPRMQQMPRLERGAPVPSPMGAFGDALKSWSNTPGAITNALSMVPEDVSFAMNFLVPGAKIPPRVSNPIRAYHGSPHDFDKFDLSKIGTGEGAQAYGHGLYFAENEGVAKSYRDTSRGLFTHDKVKSLAGDLPINDRDVSSIWWASRPDSKTTSSEAAARIQMGNPELRDPGDLRVGGPIREKLAAIIEQGRDIERGRMYEVALHATPDQFLDWDKPLSGQSPFVRDALARFGRDPADSAAVQAAKARYEEAHNQWLGRPERMDAAAESALERNVGAAYNDWIKLRGWGDKPGAGIYTDIARNKPYSSGADAFNEAGIPGIRYLDQGSRGAGQGTSNYVVWNPDIIEIMRKYGIAGPAALGIANALSQEAPDQ